MTAPTRVKVEPELLSWAIERSGKSDQELSKFDISAWKAGSKAPTVRQLKEFASSTYTPIGYLFLKNPPNEVQPIADLRTLGGAGPKIGPDLRDTIDACKLKQEWFREYAQRNGFRTLNWVGSKTISDSPLGVAAEMRTTLKFDFPNQRNLKSWEHAYELLRNLSERAGILVLRNGVVGSNTHRSLDPSEFRGFALADQLAPLIFINGKDTLAAQIFTLSHELAHLWLGESGVSDPEDPAEPKNAIEKWCNQVAAEFLVPIVELRRHTKGPVITEDEVSRLAAEFKVSVFVILRRLEEDGQLDRQQFLQMYDRSARSALIAIHTQRPKQSGGSAYNTLPRRNGMTFTKAVLADTLEGGTSYTDAFRLLGIKNSSTFNSLVDKVGI